MPRKKEEKCLLYGWTMKSLESAYISFGTEITLFFRAPYLDVLFSRSEVLFFTPIQSVVRIMQRAAFFCLLEQKID